MKPRLLATARFWGVLLACAVASPPSALPAQDRAEDVVADKPAADRGNWAGLRPTELGVRFTPAMAKGISAAFVREMSREYELNETQSEAIREIIATRLMKTIQKNARAGRDSIELMMETVIAHEGRFPKEEAQKFATTVKPLIPAFQELCIDASAEIGKKLSVTQRLKFTADMAKATAGLAIFENRMKRWEEGKVSDGANPFWDPADENPEAASQPDADPDEPPEHRRARQQVEGYMRWQVDLDEQWENYLNQAQSYFGFDEPQVNACQAILKDCRDRVKAVKTPPWRDAVKENRIAWQLTWQAGGTTFAQGPWMHQLDAAYEKLLKPVRDLDEELKRRIDAIPTSVQRAKAMERARKAFAEKGLDKLPV